MVCIHRSDCRIFLFTDKTDFYKLSAFLCIGMTIF